MDLFLKTAFAANDVDSLISKISSSILNPAIVLMAGFALVVFLYGVVEFISGSDNEKTREQGKKHIMWGLIGLVIMFGVLGIVDIIQNFVDSVKQ